MTATSESVWHNESVRSVILVWTTVVGIVLPIDFLTQIDGYLMYLRPSELLLVWGWGWLFYSAFGFLIGAIAGFSISFLSRSCGRAFPNLLSGVSRCLCFSIIVLALLRAIKLWFATLGLENVALWASKSQHSLVLITVLFCALAGWICRKNAIRISRLAISGTLIGFLLFAASPFTLFFGYNETSLAPATPTVFYPKSAKPDIILITVDALSANHLSLYGYSKSTSPNLERFAKEADVFNRFYANANFTTPATNSFINGVLPWIHRANQGMARVDQATADRGLIARLKRVGYVTMAVATNPLASPFHNRNDLWLDACVNAQTHQSELIMLCALGAHFPHVLPTNTLSLVATSCILIDRFLVLSGYWSPTDQYDPELPFAAARKLLRDRDHSHSVFLWVHLLAPHSPYATSPPFLGKFDNSSDHRTRFNSTPPMAFFPTLENDSIAKFSGRYDESIASEDFNIGRFLDWLKQENIYQNALIVISADHGESFSHHFAGHGGSPLYDDVIHVPLIIKKPMQLVGRRFNSVAEQIDLMPTILDLVRVPIDNDVAGCPLLPANELPKKHNAIFSMNFERSPRLGRLSIGSVAMIEENWKFIFYFGYPANIGLKDSLYDLQTDLAENSNVADKYPEIVARMRAAIVGQLSLHGESVQ